MKILILADIQEHGKKCAEGLLNLGHEVFYAYPKGMVASCVTIDNRVTLIELPYGGKAGYFLNYFALKKLLKKYRPDVMHVHYAAGFGLLSRLSGFHPIVLSCYGSDIFEFPHLNRFNYLLLKDILNHADVLNSTSHAMAEEVRLYLKDKNKIIDEIPFGINLDLFKPKERKREDDTKIIGFIKTLRPIYDIPLLLQAFELVCRKTGGEQPMLQLYGDGPLLPELKTMAVKLRIIENVHFMGRVANEDVPRALAEMDVFVNSSRQESFGVNVLEAMACGVPVVATDCVGPKEIIENGKSGIILKDRNPETMADAIIQLLSNENLRNQLKKEARLRVEEKYDWSKNVILLEKSLERVLISKSR